MTPLVYKRIAGFLGVAYLLLAALGAYMQQYWLMALPPALLTGYFLLQYPHLLFYLLLASIPWSIEYNFTPSLGTDLPDEPLMLLTAFAVMICLAYRWRERSWRTLHPLLGILLLQFAWMLVSTMASTHVLLSVKYALAKSWYLLAFIGAPLLFWSDPRVLKRSALVLLASMLLLMAVSIIRHADNGWTFEKINDSVIPFFRNHVNYSALLVFMVPLQIAALRLTKREPMRLFLQCLLVVTIGALYFSYARGAWLALIAGWMAYGLIRRRWLLPAFAFGFALCIAALLWLKSGERYLVFRNDSQTTIFHTDFREHLIATYQMKDVSTAERIHRWVAGFRMIDERWHTGYGPSTFVREYKGHTQPAFKTWVSANEEGSTVHNYFLLILVEQGVMGLLLFVLLLGTAFRYVQRICHRTNDPFWKQAALAAGSILVMECVINFLSDMVETDKAGSVFYLCLAVIMMADRKTRIADR